MCNCRKYDILVQQYERMETDRMTREEFPVFRKLAPYSLGTTLYQTPLNALKNKAFFIV